MATRSDERKQFLTDLLITAIEHSGYGFCSTTEYQPEADKPFAVIYDRYEAEAEDDEAKIPLHRITLDTMAQGLSVFRTIQESNDTPAQWVKDLLLADRTNGDDGDCDVIGALAVLECAIFGKVVYA